MLWSTGRAMVRKLRNRVLRSSKKTGGTSIKIISRNERGGKLKALKCKPSAFTTAHAQYAKRIYRRGHTEQREYTGSRPIPSTQNWSSIREVKKTELQRK